MPPSKRTNSAPNTTTRNLMRALKKNKSIQKPMQSCPENSSPRSIRNKMKVVQSSPTRSSPRFKKNKTNEVRSSHVNSSPQTTKKAISTNLQSKLSKKRKRVEQEKPNKEAGLKLLKRGSVTMHRIVRRKILGIKSPVSFNAKGEAYGPAATEMQSYIGVLARTKAPIWYECWKQVPNEKKAKIWECVNMAFDVPSTARKTVLKSACSKWREFKCRLTTHYILPYRNKPELLEFPPADYSSIEKAHWDLFVANRLSDNFSVIHTTQKKRRSKNNYPHYMSRKGYANLEQEMSGGDPEIEIDRSSTWLRARQDEDGNFKSDEVKRIAEEIEKMRKKVRDGEVTEEGTDDILTKVLGKPEHRGRVRGQGTNVKQSVYFHLPRQKRKGRSIDDKIQEGVQKFMKEETDRIIRERDSFWAAEMEKLKASLCAKKLDFDYSPNLGSQQGSCSKGVLKELELEGVKKKLDLIGNPDIEEKAAGIEEKGAGVEEKNQEVCEVLEVTDGEREIVIACEKANELPAKSCSLWELAVGSRSNVVAYATIDTGCDVLHGKPLGKENARVSITRVLHGSAKIPFPIQDEIITVEQAVGTYIAWPRDLIFEVKTSCAPANVTAKKSKKKLKKYNDCVRELELVVEMGGDYNPNLKQLWLWAKNALIDDRTISFELSQEAFGESTKQVILLSDVHALCSGGEISGSVICLYINILQDHLRRHKMSEMISFVNPGKIGALGCGNAGERSKALSLRFKNAKPGQIFLLPFNHVNHWALTAVIPDAQLVYHMDPLKRRIATEEWTEVVDNGIKLYKDNGKKFLKKKITWENLAGIPLQNGSKDCGLFVMRYMKEICMDKEFRFATKWLRRSNLAYSVEDINEIRIDWAEHFMSHHTA